MASLREQLTTLLSELLPTDSAKAINGTLLFEKVRPLLQGSYSENSIRTHFSMMSQDVTSPIARVSEGHGYYKRPNGADGTMTSTVKSTSDELDQSVADSGRSIQQEERVRALFIRYAESKNRFPVHIEHTTAQRRASGLNRWKFPDVVVLDWDVGVVGDSGFQLDKGLLKIKSSLGEPPFHLTSVELKVDVSFASFRENFFQCVSNSKWAHHAQLVIAKKIDDDTLVEELRRLGTSFDVSVVSLGLSADEVDRLPSAAKLAEMSAKELEKYLALIKEQRITTSKTRETLDWRHVEDVREQSADFDDLFAWISRCLSEERPYTFSEFKQIPEKYRYMK